LGTSKKINCGLLRFARNHRLQIRHGESPLHEWLELLNANKGAWQPAFILLFWVQVKKNCGLLRFARNDKLQMRHCEPPLLEWQEPLNHNKRARQSAFIFLSCVQAKR
jgi:hypothetical protein